MEPKLAHVVCAHVPADSGGTTLVVWSVLLGGDTAAAEMEAERMTQEDADGNIYFAVTVPVVQKQGARTGE